MGEFRRLGLIHVYTTEYKINKKDLLYSMGNYTQYFPITCKRKESEKKMCITITLLYT